MTKQVSDLANCAEIYYLFDRFIKYPINFCKFRATQSQFSCKIVEIFA